jgi:hypothetical protein
VRILECAPPFRFSTFGNASNSKKDGMPEYQPVSSAAISAIERPRCPKCNRNRMLLAKLEAGAPGIEYRTFECQKCGRIHRTVVSSDPMNSRMSGWLAGELRRPT